MISAPLVLFPNTRRNGHSIDCGKAAGVVYLDYVQAFDLVTHRFLLAKLYEKLAGTDPI